jgi:uncharacterized protein involved in exopolysaccharide biosynthesis
LAGLVVSVVVAFLWPDTYESRATIRITPPQIPEGLISMPVSNTDMGNRVMQMAQGILSRANLTNLINTHQLYPKERRRLPLEDIIEDMRNKAIYINPMSGGASQGQQRTMALQIIFKYENRFTAQKVCQDLVSKFIDENVRERSSSTGQLKDFVEDQWNAKKRELEAVEEQMAKFKSSNIGRTPEQQGTTVNAINGIETRMTNINASLARVNQDRLMMESQIGILRDQLRSVTTPTTETAAAIQKPERLVNLEREITNFETRLQALREQYQENHPDIRTSLANLGILKRERDKLNKEFEEAEKKALALSPTRSLRPEAAREARNIEMNIQQLQARIQNTKLEEETYKKALLDAERSARNLQGSLATMPSAEKEYEQLRLQAMLARRDFEEMDRMRNRTNATVELENRKQTEKLEVLDSASVPQNPTEPKRWVIISGGAVAGLVLGICLAGVREMKDSTLKNLKDVRAYTQLTVLGCIPLLENDLVVRRRRRLAWLAWSTACLASIAIMAGSIIFYYTSKS